MKKLLILTLILGILLCGCESGVAPSNKLDTTIPTMESMQPTEPPAGFGLGFVMPDMQITTAKGDQTTLHQLVRNNKLVVLNFWYADCPWCVREFPAIEVSYQQHKEDLEIVALSPVDALDAIASFQAQHSLSFPMAECRMDTVKQLGIRAFPTSIFIDREGKISLIHTGAITDTRIWNQLFDHYLRDDYRHQVYAHLDDVLN